MQPNVKRGRDLCPRKADSDSPDYIITHGDVEALFAHLVFTFTPRLQARSSWGIACNIDIPLPGFCLTWILNTWINALLISYPGYINICDLEVLFLSNKAKPTNWRTMARILSKEKCNTWQVSKGNNTVIMKVITGNGIKGKPDHDSIVKGPLWLLFKSINTSIIQ